MTALTHGGFALWIEYPKIGSVISLLVTVVQQMGKSFFAGKKKIFKQRRAERKTLHGVDMKFHLTF